MGSRGHAASLRGWCRWEGVCWLSRGATGHVARESREERESHQGPPKSDQISTSWLQLQSASGLCVQHKTRALRKVSFQSTGKWSAHGAPWALHEEYSQTQTSLLQADLTLSCLNFYVLSKDMGRQCHGPKSFVFLHHRFTDLGNTHSLWSHRPWLQKCSWEPQRPHHKSLFLEHSDRCLLEECHRGRWLSHLSKPHQLHDRGPHN